MDTQAAAIGGAAGELLFSGRLDNLCSCYQSLRAVIDACEDTAKQAKQKGTLSYAILCYMMTHVTDLPYMPCFLPALSATHLSALTHVSHLTISHIHISM